MWRPFMLIFRKLIRELFFKYTKSFTNSTDYWQKRYFFGGNSGKGSYGDEAIFKAEKLNKLISRFNFDGVIELGCGDGNNASYYQTEHYFGFDISFDAIKICKKKFSGNNNFQFFEIDEKYCCKIREIKNTYKLKNELAISFDVIFHLVEDDIYFDYLDKLEVASNKNLLIYSTNYDKFEKSAHVRHRLYSKELEKRGWKEHPSSTYDWLDKSFKLFQK